MSVTFAPSMGTIEGYTFECACGDTTAEHRFGSFSDAQEFLSSKMDASGASAHLSSCEDEFCRTGRMHVLPIESVPSPEINVSNSKAVDLFGLLGYESDGELMGSATAEDFAGRVLMAIAVNPADAGVPATVAYGESGHMVGVDCGRREGYFDERLDQLREIAEFAVEHGRTVQWA